MSQEQASYRVAPRGLLAQIATRAVRALDRVGGLRGAPTLLSQELTRRSLWGSLPRQAAAHPSGPPRLALTFDLDYQADTDALPALVDLVGRVGATMSVVAIGKLVEADPEPYRYALAAGHELVNHTWSHPDNPVLNPDREFWHLTSAEMRTEIGQAQDVFERLLGVRPRGFRTPHFKDARRMLDALGHFPELRYISTALASKAPLAVPYFPTTQDISGDLSLHYSSVAPHYNSDLLMIPLTPCPGVRWSPFCSYLSLRRPANPAKGCGLHSLDEFVALWQQMLSAARRDGFASVYFDPMDVMRDAETAQAFEGMLRWAIDQGWDVTTLDAIEQAWRPSLEHVAEVQS